MRRILLLGAAAASAFLAVAWARGGGGAVSPTLPGREGGPSPQRPAPSEDRSPPVDPGRNLFEYGLQDRPPKAPPIRDPREPHPATGAVAPAAPAVVLIGIVHRGRDVLAAVSILGEVVVLAPGDASSGYTLLTVDEDTGARFRGPSGDEISATNPP